jgi:hypothetical protein
VLPVSCLTTLEAGCRFPRCELSCDLRQRVLASHSPTKPQRLDVSSRFTRKVPIVRRVERGCGYVSMACAGPIPEHLVKSRPATGGGERTPPLACLRMSNRSPPATKRVSPPAGAGAWLMSGAVHGLTPEARRVPPLWGLRKTSPAAPGLGKETLAPPGGGKAIARSATLSESPQGMTENSHGRQPVGPKV